MAKSRASLRAHRSCCKVSRSVLSSAFGAHGLRSEVKVHTLAQPFAMDPFFTENVCSATCLWTT